jgi:DNA-binding transcriptional LysR family regulator
VASEPRVLALPPGHRLAGQDRIAFGDLLDEPFLALPASSAALRDHWLATDARDGRPAVIGAEVATSEETVEALLAGLGVCLVAAGNVP